MPNEIHITAKNKCKISRFLIFNFDNVSDGIEQHRTCKDRHN